MSKDTCSDPKCPVHGHLKTRGRVLSGVVKSAKMQGTVTVEIGRMHLLRKYQRYEKRYTTIKAHSPKCMNVKEGEIVEVQECRPLSKTKSFVVVRVLRRAENASA